MRRLRRAIQTKNGPRAAGTVLDRDTVLNRDSASTGGSVVARHRVSPGEGDGGLEEAPGWPTTDWAGVPKAPPGQRRPGTGPLARATVVMLRPRSIRAKLVRILVVSLALVLVLLGFLITQEATNYQAASSTSQIVTV